MLYYKKLDKIKIININKYLKKKKLDYLNSLEEIILEYCYFCGSIDDNMNGIEDDYKLNGICRKDIDIGYELDNLIPCCKMCNNIKKSIDSYIFLFMITHIISIFGLNNTSENDLSYSHLFKNCNKSIFNDYEIASKYLSKKEIDKIMNKPCYICGKYNSNIHKNGIDEINIGKYEINNFISCCDNCNYLKGKYSLFDFIYKLYEIWYNGENNIIKHDKIFVSNAILSRLNKELERYNDNKNYSIRDKTTSNKNFKLNFEKKYILTKEDRFRKKIVNATLKAIVCSDDYIYL
jgi:hypothetical protein